jgi:hypothetical protein
MVEYESSFGNLSSRLPPIKRARGYRFYDTRGRRYIDFYQNSGHALLGHRAYRLTTVMKNLISRGLIFDISSVYEKRLIHALWSLIPKYGTVGIVSSLDEACCYISRFRGVKVEKEDIVDPVISGRTGAVSYWRPFMHRYNKKADVFIPILPFSIAGSPVILCFKGKKKALYTHEIPISPLILAGMLRSFHDLKKYRIPEWLTEDMFKECNSWKQEGIYITACFGEEKYTDVFNQFLEEGVILNPLYPGPSIFPSELSAGELKKVNKLFITIPGEKSHVL